MNTPQRIAILGGTGSIGQAAAAFFKDKGWHVRIISRNIDAARITLPGMESYETLSVEGLIGVNAVINLAGAPLFGRIPTKSYKKEMRDSRIETTETLISLFQEMSDKPRVLIQGSAIGIYGSDRRNDSGQDESAEVGKDFLATLCTDWEKAAQPAEAMGVRIVYFRSGLVLDPKQKGLLQALIPPFKFFVGGIIGDARSWKSWIHMDDEINLMYEAVMSTISGPLNAVAPGASSNSEFFHALAAVLSRPCWLPVPEWLLKPVLGEMATALCQSPRVVSSTQHTFKHPELYGALTSILHS